jgi:very-short-patch-repair endonuclease
MTKAEAYLWKYVLKAGSMRGYTFRRQRPVLNYIADFMCKELMLIIEVDGSIHELEEIKIRDKKRDEVLKAAGFTILRYTNEEVLGAIDRVQEHLRSWIDAGDFPPARVRRRGR